MSLIQSARINGHDPYYYLKDVLTQLPTQRESENEHLLPQQWMPARITRGTDVYDLLDLIGRLEYRVNSQVYV